MRKAENIVMDGYLKWAKFTPAEMDTKFVPTGQYNAEFYPADEGELEKIEKEAKLRKKKLVLKDPSDGEGYGVGKWFKIQRPNVHEIDDFSGPPPVVKMKDGEQVEPWDASLDGLIGNGSKVKLKIVFYGEGDRAGHRIVKIGLIDHVVYEEEF